MENVAGGFYIALKALGFFTIAGGLLSAVAVFIGKAVIKHGFDANLERYKNNLTQENIKYKSNLDKLAEEHRVELSKLSHKEFSLYATKAKVIDKLYKELVEFNDLMIEMTVMFKDVTGMEPAEIKQKEREHAKNTALSGQAAFKYYRMNKIYFDKEVKDLMQNIESNMSKSWSDHTFQFRYSLPVDEHSFKKIQDASDKIRSEVPKLFDKLEKQFQLYLGVLNIPDTQDNLLEE
ncbi:MAG: hypothetical protein AB8F78_11395 [Saprospiraceae bacterium]